MYVCKDKVNFECIDKFDIMCIIEDDIFYSLILVYETGNEKTQNNV